MLDIKLVREETERVKQRLATRGAGDEIHIDELLKLDEERRKKLAEVEKVKAERNKLSKEIGALMGQKKTAEAEEKKKGASILGEVIKLNEAQLPEIEERQRHLLLRLPNLPHESVKVGKKPGRTIPKSGHGAKRRNTISSRSHTSNFARV